MKNDHELSYQLYVTITERLHTRQHSETQTRVWLAQYFSRRKMQSADQLYYICCYPNFFLKSHWISNYN